MMRAYNQDGNFNLDCVIFSNIEEYKCLILRPYIRGVFFRLFSIMKYSRLTKEQFEELHQEFINFLATQSITSEEWKQIKTKNPEVAEEELDIFSDLIWDGVLSSIYYLENCSPQQLFLFNIQKNDMKLIVVKTTNESIDFTTTNGYA